MRDVQSTRASRVVLVTGSSSGIGRACCDRLASSKGNRVYGGSRTVTYSNAWTHVPLDVRDDASVKACIDEVLQREGQIDAVVHCAGTSLAGPIEETTIEEAKKQFDTNYFGAVRMIRAAMPVMRQRSRGKILLIGSIGGLIGLPLLGHYSASKFALDGLVEALRTEIEPFGIQAGVIHPGDFNTALTANGVRSAETKAGSPYFDRFQRAVEFYHAAERNGGSPDVVARKVESLLSRRRLPVRVVVGSPLEVAGVFAKALLPSRGFEYIFRLAHSP